MECPRNAFKAAFLLSYPSDIIRAIMWNPGYNLRVVLLALSSLLADAKPADALDAVVAKQ